MKLLLRPARSALLVCLVTVLSSSAASASILSFELTGTGDTGADLSAHVQIVVSTDGSSATVTVTNTSPLESGPSGSPDTQAGDAPILADFGFQADATPADLDLAILAPPSRFFDNTGTNSSVGHAGPFAFRVDAVNPAPHRGLGVGDSLVFELTPRGGFVLNEDLFLNAPLNRKGFLMAARFMVVGPTGDGSGVATFVPEPATLALMLLTAVGVLLRRR